MYNSFIIFSFEKFFYRKIAQLYITFQIYLSSNFDYVSFEMVNSKRLWLTKASVYKQCFV